VGVLGSFPEGIVFIYFRKRRKKRNLRLKIRQTHDELRKENKIKTQPQKPKKWKTLRRWVKILKNGDAKLRKKKLWKKKLHNPAQTIFQIHNNELCTQRNRAKQLRALINPCKSIKSCSTPPSKAGKRKLHIWPDNRTKFRLHGRGTLVRNEIQYGQMTGRSKVTKKPLNGTAVKKVSGGIGVFSRGYCFHIF